MDIKKKFGDKVKVFRIKRGWSQEKLANISDIDRTYIPSIEKGSRNISITIIEKLAIAFEIKIKDFFNE